MVRATLISIGILVGLAVEGAAQGLGGGGEPPDSVEARYRLPEIGVTVTRGLRPLERVAAAVSVVEQASIQESRPTVGLEEALVGVPGAMVSNRYNFALGSRISIRGFGARAGFGVRGIRILQDGIPLTMPDGQAQLNNLDLGSAGRIEVIRGPASSLYGNGAGGVISVETEERPGMPFWAEGRMVVGDYGTSRATNLRKVQGKVGGQHGRGAYFVSVSRLEVDGFRRYSRSEQTQFNGRVRVGLDEVSQLTLILNAADVPVAENPGSLPADSAARRPSMAWPRNVATRSGESARQVQGGLAYTRAFGDDRLDVSVYALGRELENPLPILPVARLIALDRVGGGVRAAYRAAGSLGGRPSFLTAGVDLEMQQDDRQEFNNVNGAPGDSVYRDQLDRVLAAGPFLQAQWVVHPQLELTFGARLDAVRFRTSDRPARVRSDGRILKDTIDDSGGRTYTALSPMAGLSYALRPGLNLYATVATSFQTPTTTELINAPPGPDGRSPGGFNNALEPQRAISYEAGLKGRLGSRVWYEAAVYTTEVTGELVSYEDIGGRQYFRNAGRSRHRGLELAAGVQGPAGITAQLAYTYSDARIRDDGLEGNRIPGISPHHLYARAGWRHRSGFHIEADVEAVGEYYADNANSPEAVNPGYAVAGVRLGIDRRVGALGIMPFVGINNLFDRRYNGSVVINAAGGRYFEPAPGRSLYFGLTVPYGGAVEGGGTPDSRGPAGGN